MAMASAMQSINAIRARAVARAMQSINAIKVWAEARALARAMQCNIAIGPGQ